MPVPSTLWKTAAILYAIAIPGHVAGGLKLIHPLLNKIPVTSKEDRIGQRSAQNCYNYVNISLAIAGLLSWQWARTNGPKTLEEKTIFWTLLLTHLIYGYRYLQVGEYSVISVMWTAPALSLAAYKLGGSA